MAILAIATSGPHGGLALRPDGGEVRLASIASGRGRGRDVMPALEGLLAESELTPEQLTALVVDVGPGSFTGVRVGVTIAKTLGWTLGLRVHTVGSLELLLATADDAPNAIAVRDAGRGTVYHGRRDQDGVLQMGREAGSALDVPKGALIVGEAAAALAETHGWQTETRDVAPSAAELLAFAESRALEAIDAHAVAPVYLQASAPERKAAGEVD